MAPPTTDIYISVLSCLTSNHPISGNLRIAHVEQSSVKVTLARGGIEVDSAVASEPRHLEGSLSFERNALAPRWTTLSRPGATDGVLTVPLKGSENTFIVHRYSLTDSHSRSPFLPWETPREKPLEPLRIFQPLTHAAHILTRTSLGRHHPPAGNNDRLGSQLCGWRDLPFERTMIYLRIPAPAVGRHTARIRQGTHRPL